MHVTLVSHYGPKPSAFASLIRACHEQLNEGLGAAFRPYGIEQVHGTIIGLEGTLSNDGVLNRNALALGERTHVDLDAVLRFVREEMPRIDVRVGGFSAAADYAFTSRGQHPFERSFSIQGDIAVGVGWPSSAALDLLRWTFWNRFGVRHAYHKSLADHDNDFFFVLGRVDRSVADSARAVDSVRRYLAAHEPVVLAIEPASLQIVGYVDPQLPIGTSRVLEIADPAVTADAVRSLYAPSS